MNYKEALSIAAVAAVTVGVIFRVEMLRSMVAGIQTTKVDASNPKAPRSLYV